MENRISSESALFDPGGPIHAAAGHGAPRPPSLHGLLEATLNRLPLGIALTDTAGTIVSINHALREILRAHRGLAMDAGRLVSRPQRTLAEALKRAGAATREDVALRLVDELGGLSIWISHVDDNSRAMLAVQVASTRPRPMSEPGLRAMFGMTRAESRLADRLMRGRSLDEAASDLGISINTVRTQLKSLFAKVGVQRQSDLVRVIGAAPLPFEGHGPND